ncbi:hypothetical protein V8E53_012386 [Lactarius tabidus]
MARVVARPLPPVRRHPLHMPPTPTSTTQPSAAPWPQRERGRRQRGHPPSMSPSSPPVRPLLTTDAQTAHAVVAQSPHVCGCLCADGSRCRASFTTQPSAVPWPRRERGRRQRGHPPSMSPSSPPVRPLQNPHAALSRQCDAALCSGGGHCPLQHPRAALS